MALQRFRAANFVSKSIFAELTLLIFMTSAVVIIFRSQLESVLTVFGLFRFHYKNSGRRKKLQKGRFIKNMALPLQQIILYLSRCHKLLSIACPIVEYQKINTDLYILKFAANKTTLQLKTNS